MSGKIQAKCCTPRCKNLQVALDNNYLGVVGQKGYRKWCQKCHEKRIADSHGLSSLAQVVAKNAGYKSVSQYSSALEKKRAKKQGVSVTALRRKYHKYRWAMKDYCENISGFLGFKCTSTVFPDKGMLHVDHIDGSPVNNDPNNYQTLCACCHAYKTNTNRDYSTPGRKMLGIKS